MNFSLSYRPDTFARRISIALGCFLLNAPLTSRAAVEAPQAAPPQTPVAAAVTDARLQKPLTITARRQSIIELLSEVEKQSGVVIVINETAALDGKLVTLRVKNLPVSAFLESLGKLYGVEARRDDQGRYQLQRAAGSAFERLLPQLGSASANSTEAAMKAPIDWATGILNAVDGGALRSKAGVALSDLPDEIQTQLRERIGADTLFFAADRMRLLSRESLTNGVLQARTQKVLHSDPRSTQRWIEKSYPDILEVQLLNEEKQPVLEFQLAAAESKAETQR